MAGTLNIALTQQFDINGEPLGGGLLYFFAAASTTPQNAFQDIALTIVHPNPIVLAADGRVPMFYLASTAAEGNPSGQIKIRLTDYTGVTVLAADSLLIVGPASGGGGGGGGGGVDDTSVLHTGDILLRFGTGDWAGFVPCNGETIGSEVSGARYFGDEFQFLFEHLWATGVLGVFAGTTPARGSTANGDWVANRRILLPDLRGKTIAGMDDMGASAAGILTAAGLGVPATVLGNVGGSQTISAAQLAQHTHPLLSNVQFGGSAIIGIEVDFAGTYAPHYHGWGSLGRFSGGVNGVNGRFQTLASSQAGYTLDHAHPVSFDAATQQNQGTPGGSNWLSKNTTISPTTGLNSSAGYSLDHVHNFDIGGNTGDEAVNHYHTLQGSTQLNAGLATGQVNVQPTMVLTFYIKL